jgi:hypothetical protein
MSPEAKSHPEIIASGFSNLPAQDEANRDLKPWSLMALALLKS